MTSERNVYTVRRTKLAVGEKKKKTSLADIFPISPHFCLFLLRTAEPGTRLMLVRNLFLSLLPSKSCF